MEMASPGLFQFFLIFARRAEKALETRLRNAMTI